MKRNYFSVVALFVFCFLLFGLVACKPSPCKMPTAKNTKDSFVIILVDKGDGTYVAYLNLEGNITVVGEIQEIGNNPNEPNCPIVSWIKEGSAEPDYLPVKKDQCGYYVILEEGEHSMMIWMTTFPNQPYNPCGIIDPGNFVSDWDQDMLIFDPAEVYKSL